MKNDTRRGSTNVSMNFKNKTYGTSKTDTLKTYGTSETDTLKAYGTSETDTLKTYGTSETNKSFNHCNLE